MGRPTNEPVVSLARAPRSEPELIAALLEEEPAAIAELFTQFGGVVRRMLIRTLGNATDVEDLTQETFLTVLRRLGTLRDDASLASFVIGVAIRVAKNEMRKRALRRWVGLDSAPVETVSPDPELRDSVARLYRALDRLDASARVLFVLRYVEELELTELAAAMNVSLSTIKRQLVAAERRFEAIARHDPVLCRYLEGQP